VISHTYQPLYTNGSPSIHDMGWLNVFKQSLNIVLHERVAVWRKLYEQQYPEKEVIWISPEPDDMDFFLAPDFSFRPEVQKELVRSGEIAALKALSQSQESGAHVR
jgi:hypothetical protein